MESMYFPLSSITGWFGDNNVVATRICKHTNSFMKQLDATWVKVRNKYSEM